MGNVISSLVMYVLEAAWFCQRLIDKDFRENNGSRSNPIVDFNETNLDVFLSKCRSYYLSKKNNISCSKINHNINNQKELRKETEAAADGKAGQCGTGALEADKNCTNSIGHTDAASRAVFGAGKPEASETSGRCCSHCCRHCCCRCCCESRLERTLESSKTERQINIHFNESKRGPDRPAESVESTSEGREFTCAEKENHVVGSSPIRPPSKTILREKRERNENGNNYHLKGLLSRSLSLRAPSDRKNNLKRCKSSRSLHLR
ncbi:UNVERIFIED_CONTAM: hypothetical protein PYX00_005119 [Menopon gallinae]|uniref:Uncharacterized protein n=1 Tax=Menopon gallinae TaxID=328185 RepID=A0AAW2HQ51_9NEOP